MAAAQTNGDHEPKKSLAQDLFEDMGRQVERMTNGQPDGTDVEQKVVDEIESLCMNCHENGTTRLLLTQIPFFHEIIIMSFTCPHCHFKNNEIQSAGEIQPKGAKFALRVDKDEDLQRQVVKSDICIFRVEDLDLEIPAGRGQYTNIEGVLSGVKQDLESHQDARMEQMPEVGAKVAGIISALGEMLEGQKYPFMVSVDDYSGNSSIEPRPGDSAGKWAKSEYNRTPAQNALLGLGEAVPGSESQAPEPEIRPEYHATGFVGADPAEQVQGNNVDQDEIVENQVYGFPASCPGCTRQCTTNMKMVNIPYFKQVVLMATFCDLCGYKSNEVKTGGEVPEKGRRITLKVTDSEDLTRDLLKSETAAFACPELQLHVEPGTMGGRFTTVEGIMTQIRRDLRAQAFGLADGDAELPERGAGDGMEASTQERWDTFFANLTDAIEGRREFTLILEDPLAASYVQSLTAPAPDPKITIEDYERTDREEEDLGLKDIKTEGYEEDEAAEKKAEGETGAK